MKKEEISKRIEEIENELKQLRNKLQDEDKYFSLDKLSNTNNIFTDEASVEAGFYTNSFMMVRGSGEYRYKSFYLSDYYNWELLKDSNDILCLIPTKK